MHTQTRFTVLIERSAWRGWGNLLGALLALTALALMFAAQAQAGPRQPRPLDLAGLLGASAPQGKLARDLDRELRSARKGGHRWSREADGRHHVQLVVISNSSDRELTQLRAEVKRLGGATRTRLPLVNGLTIRLPADQVQTLAARSDVASISPNREVRRTASVLETASGALTSAVRSYASGSYSGLDGSGVGIAVLDSGVMRNHRSFHNASGSSRVVRNVDMLKANLSDWLNEGDGSLSLMPGSSALASYNAAIAADTGVAVQDPYGHGTHVASVAAGRAFYQTPDSTGVAPGASIYDVKVLGADGNGTLSDVLEGVQWVVFNAKVNNIRVMNLSLASASAESWLTDPLCIAVRAASAAGITVVVAAGNFGLSAEGQEVYGTISSPGNDPSVITVGSANFKGTGARSDDVVNHFSSRGPTRGARLVNGVRVADNLLKPDLVAPGNRVFGAAATRASSLTPTWNALAVGTPALVTATGASQTYQQTLMALSGTSIAAPAVAGTVALMLQANPGLTPPLIKAILQYTAQTLPNANLLQQGAGMLNADGAVGSPGTELEFAL